MVRAGSGLPLSWPASEEPTHGLLVVRCALGGFRGRVVSAAGLPQFLQLSRDAAGMLAPCVVAVDAVPHAGYVLTAAVLREVRAHLRRAPLAVLAVLGTRR